MNRTKLGRAILAALPFLIALILALVLAVTLADRLPARMASHFSASGDANGHMGRGAFLLTTVLVMAPLGALWAWMAARGRFPGRSYDGFAAAGYATAAFFGYLTTATLLLNVDVSDSGPEASFTMWHLVGACGAAVVAAALGLCAARLLPPSPDEPRSSGQDGARISLTDGEVAGWARSATSWWLPLTAGATAAVGVALMVAMGPAAGVPLLVIGVLILTFARPNVTVDRRGLTVSGLLPWPRVRIPLERIEGATSQDVNALSEYGGWGYRFRPTGSGVIIRSGEAIVATLESGRHFAVTVDDSATGAALLNTLVDRRRGRH